MRKGEFEMTENANVQLGPEGPTGAQDLPDGSRATGPSGYTPSFSLDENGKAVMTPDDYQRLLDRIWIPENPYLELSDRQARRHERRQARKQAKRDARAATKAARAEDTHDNDKAREENAPSGYTPSFSLDENGKAVMTPDDYQRLLDRIWIPENPYLELSDRQARRYERRQARKQAKRDARAATKAARAGDTHDNDKAQEENALSGYRPGFSLDENGKAVMTPDDWQRLIDRIWVPENPYLELSDRQARRRERRQARKQAKRDARAAEPSATPAPTSPGGDAPRPA